MEAVHKPHNRAWIDRDIINVKQFLDEWKDDLSFESLESNINDTCLESLVSKEEYDNIKEECGHDALTCQYQELVEQANNLTIPSGVNLKTLEFQSDDLKQREDDPKYYKAVYYSLRYLNCPPQKNLSAVTDASGTSQNLIVTPEVVLSVQFFQPERSNSAYSLGYNMIGSFTLDQEVLVLGCQFLSELRDKIQCVSDDAISGDFSDYPNTENASTCKELYKSGFFYINEVFYNDMRDNDCRDYSETIIKWAEKGKRGVGPFKKAVLEKTRFIDLDIQLGYPYVYTHQGDCEHLMVFSDLRMFSDSEVKNRDAYPLYVQVKPSKRFFCMICHKYTASWIVHDNKRLPENPYYFCKICFVKFNYDKNNQKIGSFRAYHLPDFSKLY